MLNTICYITILFALLINAGLFPVCKDNTTFTGDIQNFTGSLLQGQYVQLTCNVTYTSSIKPSIQWTDYDGASVNNATISIEGDHLVSSILIPGYVPLVKQFICIVSDMYYPANHYNCTTKNISVSKYDWFCSKYFKSFTLTQNTKSNFSY